MDEEKSYFEQMMDTFQTAYQKYNEKFKVLPTDNFFQKIIKFFGRIAVLILMILLSPILFMGLFVAFVGVF